MSSRSVSRRRAWAIGLGLVLPVVLMAPAPAFAGGPVVVPVITSPDNGSVVTTKNVDVAATTSMATHVRFIFGDQLGDTGQLVPVDGGVAAAQFSTLGFNGSTTVSAFDCDSGGSCAGTGAEVSVTVNLQAPVITAPTAKQYVGDRVTVKATAPGGALEFYLDGAQVKVDDEAPYEQRVSLDGASQGTHSLTVKQCNDDASHCEGKSDTVTVIKDTRAPSWSDVRSSQSTVYPAQDNYKDTTTLSARVAEALSSAKVEIRKSGGPIVRTLKLGREDKGGVRAQWNGRKANGSIVPNGKYLFRFIGVDKAGLVGKSNDKVIRVSDKKLVKKKVTKTVGALSSGLGDYSGDCSRVVTMRSIDGYARHWRNGLQWQSNATRNCSGAASVALSAHVGKTERAIKYGAFQISAFGAAALKNGGAAKLLYLKKNETVGARQNLGTGLGWHKGDREALGKYLFGTKLVWYVGTANGNWYDIKEFRIQYSVTVLR